MYYLYNISNKNESFQFRLGGDSEEPRRKPDASLEEFCCLLLQNKKSQKTEHHKECNQNQPVPPRFVRIGVNALHQLQAGIRSFVSGTPPTELLDNRNADGIGEGAQIACPS